MKTTACVLIVAFIGLVGWRVNVLLNPPEKPRKLLLEEPKEQKKSAVQEWLKDRDQEEKRNVRTVRMDPDE